MDIFSSLSGLDSGSGSYGIGISMPGEVQHGVTASTLSFGEKLAEAVEQRAPEISATLRGDGGAAPIKETLSRQEIMQLRDVLEKNGLPRSIANSLNSLAEGTENASLTQVMQKLRQQVLGGTAQALEGADNNAARQLLQKLGFNADESQKLLDAMAQGEGSGVWREIMNRISSADKDEFFAVSGDEINALAKGLGLSDGVVSTLQQMFGNGEIQANNDGLKQLLSSISQEIAGREQALKQLNQSLAQSMGDIMAQLRNQNSRTAQSDNRGSKTADLSEAMIRETVTGKGDEAPGLGLSGGRDHDGSLADGREGHSLFGKRENRSTGSSAWDTLLSRVSVSADSVVNGLQQGQSYTQAQAAAQGQQGRAAAHLSEQAAQQVEKAILSNMHDGAKQLALKLNPPELGALTVTLVVRGNELSAILKADQPETAQLLSEQAQQLRQSLEEQGIKVAKMEVQTELHNDAQQKDTWQGTEEHNMQQREQARTEERERFQRLRRLREADSGALAQDMLIRSMPEISAQGLSLIA